MNQSVKLYVEDRGSGTPLVLLHGFPLDHTIWNQVVLLLEAHVRVLSPDLRGHGRSPAPQGVYTMELLAKDVAAMLDDLHVRRVVLAGHSMGGYVALAFAQAYPERVSALALVGSHAAADAPERRKGRYETAEEVLRQGVSGVANAMAPKLTLRAELVEPLHRLILKNAPEGVAGALQAMAERPDRREFLAGLDLPVLYLVGDHDPFVSLELAQAQANRLQRGELRIAIGAAHMPMLETPQFVADALKDLAAQVNL